MSDSDNSFARPGRAGKTGIALLLTVLFAGLVPVLVAQTPAADLQDTIRVPELALPNRPGISGEQALTLEEVVALVLENNKDVVSSRINQEVADFDLLAALGAFDPVFGVDTSWRRSVTPVSSVIGGGPGGRLTQTEIAVTPRLNGLIPATGGSFQLDLDSRRQTTDNTFVTLNPQFPANFTFNLIQPLLRGLHFDQNRFRIEVGKKNQTLSDEQLRLQVIESVTTASQAYWELAFARRNLEVQLEAVNLARQQVESNDRMADQGILAPIDVVEAQTQLAAFEQDAYRAQDAVTRAENRLKAAILPDRSAPLWSRGLIPVTPFRTDAPAGDLQQAMSTALANRPELERSDLSLEIAQLNSRLFREDAKPQIDVVGTYTSSGLAGRELPSRPNPFTAGLLDLTERVNVLSSLAGLPALPPNGPGSTAVPRILVGGLGQSYENILRNRFPTAAVSLRFSLPLRNRTAEGNLGASLAIERRIENERQQLEQLVETDVRNSLQAVLTAQSRLEAARAERQAAEAQQESEQRKFRAGTSTVFLVLQRQNTLIAARNRELRVEADLSQALDEFDRATAGTLDTHRIAIISSRTVRSTREESSASGRESALGFRPRSQ